MNAAAVPLNSKQHNIMQTLEDNMLHSLTSSHFQPYLNETFCLEIGADTVEVELTAVTELGPIPQDPTARRAFSLIFRGSREFFLPQRIYHMTHAQMGALDIFLVPVGPDAKGMQYQALFN